LKNQDKIYPISLRFYKEQSIAEPLCFQWQNDVLCKTIYPMHETKLCDLLVYYMEVYKDKDIAALSSDVGIYT